MAPSRQLPVPASPTTRLTAMSVSVGLLPPALPEFLTAQLEQNNFKPGDAALCASMLNEAVDRAKTAALFVDLGSCKFLDGDIDGAIAAWRHAMTSDRSKAGAGALLNLGLLFEHLDLHEQALGVLAAVEDRDDHTFSHDAALATARCQRALGDADAAMETMARRAQVTMRTAPESPQLTDTLYAFGVIAAGANRLDRAERAWRAALVAEPSPSRQAASASLVGLLLERGHDDALIDVLMMNGAIEPAHLPAVLERVLTAYRMGDADQAVALAESISGRGLDATDQFRLVDVRLEVGLINEAIDDLEVLLGNAEVEVQLRAGFILGEVYRTYEMYEPAAAMYQRIVDAGDTYWSPKAALCLGDIALADGRTNDAAAYWDQAASCSIASIRRRADARYERLLEPETEAELAARLLAEPTSDGIEDELSADDLVDFGDDELAEIDLPEPQWADDDVTVIEVPTQSQAAEPVELVEDHDVYLGPSGADEEPAAEPVEIFDPAFVIEPPHIAGPPAMPGPDVGLASMPREEPLVIDLAALAEDQATSGASGEGAGDEPAAQVVESADDQASEVDQTVEEPTIVVLSDLEESAADPPNNVYHLDVAARRNAAKGDRPNGFERLIQEELASGTATDVADVPVEPLVVSGTDADESTATGQGDDPVVIDLNDFETPARNPSPFGRIVQGEDFDSSWANPYASLAPSDGELFEDYVSPSRNPYAELAPNYHHDDVLVDADIEPGDWESMLADDWPRSDPTSPGSFSRHT